MLIQNNAIETAKRYLYLTLDLQGDQNYVFDESLNISREELDDEKLKQKLDDENYTLKSLRVLAELDRFKAVQITSLDFRQVQN